MANYKDIISLDPDGVLDIEFTAEKILRQTDWTQLPDAGLTDACVALFKTYRASIRTIRRTKPNSPTWPNAPTEEYS